MGDIERVRVLVVGDSGVGKTSLTWLLRSGESFVSSSKTYSSQIFQS